MQSMLINTEALESPLYNPPADPKALMLQQIMETTPIATNARTRRRRPFLVTPDEVELPLREHVATFNSLSMFNPFEGVIVNPTDCLVNPIRDDLRGTYDYMQGRFSDNGTWQNYRSEYLWNLYGPTLQPSNPSGDGDWDYDGDDDGIIGDLDCVQDHTDQLTNNLPSLAGIAQAAMALDTVMNLLSNPCLGLSGFLGSIMDKGKALLKSAMDKVQGMLADARAWVDANIGPLIDKIKSAIASAKAAITQFIADAKAEVMKFAKAMLAQIRQGLAELLANLPQDPCLRGLLGSVATGAAAAVIGG